MTRSLQDIKIALDGFSAAPGKGTAEERRFIHRVKNITCELDNALSVEELNGGNFRLTVVWARTLADVTAPGGVVLSHKVYLGLCELALLLSHRTEAIASLSSEDSRRAGSFASTAVVAMSYLTR